MADFPTSRLYKALARRGDTAATRPAWQESMARHDTVPSKAIMAPEVIKGFTGSWAAQYVLDPGVKTTNVSTSPAPVQRQVNHLGQPGMAEINFRPYDWGTTRQGKYGPSLLGHPVSFQVVGPTAKDKHLLHQWRLNTAGAADVLTLDSCTWRSTGAVPEALPANLNTTAKIYGISAIPEEGLYLVVSLTGQAGRLDDTGGGVFGYGGVGDGMFGEDLAAIPARAAISAGSVGQSQKPKHEIFRVVAMDATTLTLDSSKRIRDYFRVAVPGLATSIIRAIMLIKPAAARLVAVPGSGTKGKEQVFAFVPPEKSLNADLMPPYERWTTDNGFDPWLNYTNSAALGEASGYVQANALPIPKVIRQGQGRLQGFPEVPAVLFAGLMKIILAPLTTFSASDVGKVVHIRNVLRVLDGNWSSLSAGDWPVVGDPEIDRLQGYWEIVAASAGAGPLGEDVYNLRMITQVDPLTGVPFYGSADILMMSQNGSTAGQEVRFQWTLHDSISELWTSAYPQQDKLDSARLRPLIDPSWVEATAKNFDVADAEASPARADKAVFATGTSNAGADGSNEDPGSLMDLGFRVVLFPAKASALDPTKLIPDFNNPITSNEVVLDPTKADEKQFVEIDYSAGLVYLSHPPIAGTGCQLAPTAGILTNASNPRGEMVFFASFVPFSQEPGQRSVAPRVTGGQSVSGAGSSCTDTFTESADVYGQRLHWPVANAQTITTGTTTEIKLSVQLDAIELPSSGFVELVYGYDAPVGTAIWLDGQNRRVSTFGYTEVEYIDAGNGGNTTLKGLFGGGVAADTVTASPEAPLSVVLRRDIVTPNKGDGTAGTDFEFDTTYGYSKRSSALRFKRAQVTAEADGSVMVDTRDPLTESHQELFSELFSSWVIRGGTMTTAIPAIASNKLTFTELVVLIAGIRTVIPAQTIQVDMTFPGPPVPIYVYIDGTNPSCPVYATTNDQTLPNPQDVLIGRYNHTAVDITGYQDLRNPLVDIDKRIDITVGVPVGFDQPGDAHFATLADAVTYVAETTKPYGGFNGKYRRIKVIGPTHEVAAKLPIQPMTQGLIIEGASRRHDGQPSAPLAISWGYTDAAATALFDLSGCDGLVIRDLVFEFVSTGPLAPSAIPRNRCLFTCDQRGDAGAGLQYLRDVVIENVKLIGPAHGFFYCQDDLDADTGFERLRFTNCWAENLTDFAIFVGTTVNAANYLTVDKCRFVVRKITDVPAPELTPAVGVHEAQGILHHAGGNATNWVIRDTYLSGGTTGIYLGGSDHTIQETYIRQTDQIGIILLGSDSRVDHADLAFVHTEVPQAVPAGRPAARSGIWFSVAGTRNSISNTAVSIDTPVLGNYSLYCDDNNTNPVVALRNNDFGSAVKAGPYSVVEGNRIADKLTVGTHTHVAFNNVTVGTDTGDLVVGTFCTIVGNEVAGRYEGAADCKSSNNLYLGAGTAPDVRNQCSGDVFTGQVIFTNGCVFSGCTFNGGILHLGITYSGDVQENRFEGCYIKVTADTAILARNTLFSGCYFESSGGSFTFSVDGYRNTFLGNHFDDAFTLRLFDLTAAARTELLVQGNRMRGATEGGMWITGNYCTIADNVIQGYENASVIAGTYSIYLIGDNNNVSGNNCTQGLNLDGGNNTITGNVAATKLDVSGGPCTVTGNTSSTGLWLAPDSLYSGNSILTSLIVDTSATLCLVQGNFVGTTAQLRGTTTSYLSNRIEGALTATAPDSIMFKNNFVGGAATFGSAGSFFELVDNTFVGTVTVPALGSCVQATFSGNHFVGAVDFSNAGIVSLENCTFVGNHCASTFTCQYAVRTTFQGNRFQGTVDLSNSNQLVVQGNWVGGSAGAAVTLTMSTCDDYVCVGNYVTGTILVDAGAGANAGILVGNRAAVLGTDAVPNAGTVDVANRTTNAGGNTNFNTAPGVVTPVANNTEV